MKTSLTWQMQISSNHRKTRGNSISISIMYLLFRVRPLTFCGLFVFSVSISAHLNAQVKEEPKKDEPKGEEKKDARKAGAGPPPDNSGS